MEKAFWPIECNDSTCYFQTTCCKCATEIVKSTDSPICDILFVGQGAGAEEDQKGRPFQGPAGRVLRQLVLPSLNSHSLNIALDNTIRSRPQDFKGKNRAPTEEEVGHCMHFLEERIAELNPLVIIPVGASATQSMLPETKGTSISRIRGKYYMHRGRLFRPTFHPAAILHCQDQERKSMLEGGILTDISTVVAAITELREERISSNSNS